MNKAPRISVIIPFAGKQEDLLICLDSLYNNRSEIEFEIIVVQSGSKESLADHLNTCNNLTLLHFAELLYPGKARNIGFQRAKSNYIAFIDADCIPCNNWIDIAYSTIAQCWETILGPILNQKCFKSIASVDNLLQFVDFQKFRPLKKISHFSGTNFVILRKVFEKAGGFREDLLAGEDVLFSQKAIDLCEGKIFFNKKLVVKHRGRNTFKGFIEHQKTFGYYRGLHNLKIKSPKFIKGNNALYSIYLGLKRLIYINLRTFQWNPKAIPMLIFYSPLIFLGLFSWSIGFYNGIKKVAEIENEI